MASTNKTTNYELSQFVGTDKPAWLSDYNGDMAKIDAGVHTAQTTATGADGKADANATKIGTLSSLTTTVKTDAVSAINEVNTLAGSANTAAGTALSTANSAGNKADTALNGLNRFNLTTHTTLTPSTDKGSVTGSSVNFSTDSTNSVFKIYGYIDLNIYQQTGSVNITLGTTTLRPETAYSITGGALVVRYVNGVPTVFVRDVSIATNGVITISAFQATNATNAYVYLPPCIYFNSDFGDTPTPDA